ncbi:MAG: dihydroorotase [Kiritimatiellae bacterium]|nr:dihydroorotase [Kiritimatiellia bacterium]
MNLPRKPTGAAWRLVGGRLLDPASGTDRIDELAIADRHFVPAGDRAARSANVLDVSGRIIAPAFIDLHVHLREPGMEEAETIRSGLWAAAAGGFGAVVSMPNTSPPVDSPALVRRLIETAERVGGPQLWPAACLTRSRAGGEVAEIEALVEAGAVAFTDDGSTVSRDDVMEAAMRRVAAIGSVVLDHAQDHARERLGVAGEGAARRLGVPAIPAEAEISVVERDIRLVRATGCRLHVQHLSTAGGVEALRRARAEGLPVTAEVTPHHLALCEDDIPGDDANYKMNPPLRSERDRAALRSAVLEGVVTCLATDHAPHPAAAKAKGFLTAPFGVIGLETAIGVTWEVLVLGLGMSPLEWVRRWTCGPAAVLRRAPPSLAPGAPAHAVVISLNTEWTVVPARFRSRSRNTPFAGWRLHAKPEMIILDGKVFDLSP